MTGKRVGLKYISRIDSGHTHCWFVRVGYCLEDKRVKSFSDLKLGGTGKALKAAKKWRDAQLKEYLPRMQKGYGYDVNKQRHWGKGVNEAWDRKGEWEYLYIVATYWDGRKGKQLHKYFSVGKFGYDKATMLAKQWRNFKLTGEL